MKKWHPYVDRFADPARRRGDEKNDARCRQRVTLVPTEVRAAARDTMGAFFESISNIDRNVAASDFLDTSKALKRAAILERYVSLGGTKLLEIGSGFGTNLAVWIPHFSLDGYGIEPSGAGFEAGYGASLKLLEANGIDPKRIVDCAAEDLPFANESFDIVYSANVLEHTVDPERVLSECMRVLRRGGTLHMEMPNHLSYFEGHYMLLQPPLLFHWMLPLWVSLFGRDPAFARTLQTQINPFWCKRILRRISSEFSLEIVSFGEELFLERVSRPFEFETSGVAAKLGNAIELLRFANRFNWIGRLIVTARGHYPIYLTVRRR